ncbi:hypothetical protein [Lachnoclostridium sp. An76]|uniref:hypothetical protein n=1 Tax=Lachnoclostridium sp. An76 TaxID=1965654 RepID=UPI00117A1B98|nr:hypothetical protein [Lachnoclostridium sp. An76]
MKNSKKPNNRKLQSKKKRIINSRLTAGIMIGIAILAAVIIIAVFMMQQGRRSDEDNRESSLGNGIYIVSSEPYTGPFWEDGSDAAVEDIWSLKIVNSSDEDIEYLKIHAATAEAEGNFEVTVLPAGGELIVLESSAAAYPQDAEDARYDAENLAFFQEERSILPEQLTLYGQDNWIKAENISGEDIAGDICVYYKNLEDGIFQGGITYRAVFPGGMAAGEAEEQEVLHYMKDTSQIMYVTYDQE